MQVVINGERLRTNGRQIVGKESYGKTRDGRKGGRERGRKSIEHFLIQRYSSEILLNLLAHFRRSIIYKTTRVASKLNFRARSDWIPRHAMIELHAGTIRPTNRDDSLHKQTAPTHLRRMGLENV